MERPEVVTNFSCLVGVLRSDWLDTRDFHKAEHLPPLVVPDFQRLYEWPEEMVSNFTTKLFDTFKRRKGSFKDEVMFASTVFLHLKRDYQPDEEEYDNFRCRALILDGQQRLVTISLLILVVLDRLQAFVIENDEKMKLSVSKTAKLLREHIYFKTPSGESHPSITLHTDQHEIWADFVEPTTNRKAFDAPQEKDCEKIFLKNYLAIDMAIDEALSENSPSDNTRLASKRQAQELLDFSKALLVHGICKSVLLVRHGVLQLSLRMLSGINTPGRPLDAVSYLKFHLIGKREADDQSAFRELLKKLDSSTPMRVVLVAASALLKDVTCATQEVTDDLTILMEALEVFGDSNVDMPVYFGVSGGRGLSSEEAYWSSAIQVSQYLEELDASSKNNLDRLVMPLLALSRLKSSKTSTAGKTLRLIQSLLVAVILSFGGKLREKNGILQLYNIDENSFKTYLSRLQTFLLHALVIKNPKCTREGRVQQVIDAQLQILKDNEKDEAVLKLTLADEKLEELLVALHSSSTNPKHLEDMFEAGINFAVLLACQPPSSQSNQQYQPDGKIWRFDGLDDFQLEHIASQNSRGQQVDGSLLHRLGNLCMIESSLNSSAGNKSFSEKKNVYKDSLFWVPWFDLRSSYPNDFLEVQLIQRHELMLTKLSMILMPHQHHPSQKFVLPAPVKTQAEKSPVAHRDLDSPVEITEPVQLGDDLKQLLNDRDHGSLVRVHFPKGCKASFKTATREHFEAVFYVRKKMRGTWKHENFSLDVKYSALDKDKPFDKFATKWVPYSKWNNWKRAAEAWWRKQGGFSENVKRVSTSGEVSNAFGKNRDEKKRPRDVDEEKWSSEQRSPKKSRPTYLVNLNDTDESANGPSTALGESTAPSESAYQLLLRERSVKVEQIFKCLDDEKLDKDDRIHTLGAKAKQLYEDLIEVEDLIDAEIEKGCHEAGDDFRDFPLAGQRGILRVGEHVFDRRKRNDDQHTAWRVLGAGLTIHVSKFIVCYKVEEIIPEGVIRRRKMKYNVPSEFLHRKLEDASYVSPRRPQSIVDVSNIK